MIVLDEQLLGRGIEEAIGHWYPGSIVFITDLRPNSVIKDEAIPTLLAQAGQPTFVTINASDFWQRFPASERFCMVCFALSDARADQIPTLLRRLLRHPEFSTRARRMGRIVRVTTDEIQYYSHQDPTPSSLPL